MIKEYDWLAVEFCGLSESGAINSTKKKKKRKNLNKKKFWGNIKTFKKIFIMKKL